MDGSTLQPVTDVNQPDLDGAIERLQHAGSVADSVAAARSLLAVATSVCSEDPPVGELVAAADALHDALVSVSSVEAANEIRSVIHQFIDLARLKAVRRAAYPAEGDTIGARWINRICRLIEASAFHVGRMFRQRAAAYTEKMLFRVPHGEQVTDYSWPRVSEETSGIARGILSLLGDDAKVAVFSPNRIESALVDLACLTNGIFDAMVPANVVPAQLEHILAESGAQLLFVSGSEQLQHALTALAKLDALQWVVALDALPRVPNTNVMTLQAMLDRGLEVPPEELSRRQAGVQMRETATTMYTSGTTGAPKGIRFSHLNLVSKRYARVAALPEIDESEVFLCYLPLYHTFGRYLEMLASVHLAATYVLAENASTETLIRHMRRFHPTAMISVPKKWMDLYQRVTGQDQEPRYNEESRAKLQALTGGRLAWGLSAAGRLDPAVFRFFQANGVDLLSGYGMTEATGGITMTPPGGYVEDSIGKALPGIELKLDEDGELLLRGPYVSDGYTDPQDDAVAFRDGWFCTGDIVGQDNAGYLRHVDRKKDIYKNSGGRTVAPQRVESLFADFPEISRVFAVGDGRDYVTLLIRQNVAYQEVGLERMTETERHEYFRGLVASCNRFLAPFERVVQFTLIDRDFSVEKGELTAKESFRRSVVEKNFADAIKPMYESSTIERAVDGLRVRVPISFLQHLGTTSMGVLAEPDGIVFRAIGKKLRIQRDPDVADRAWIGNCCYDAIDRAIDLDNWLRLPHLWVGNAELTHISGESILLWSLSGEERSTPSRMVAIGIPAVPTDEWLARFDGTGTDGPSLLSVHAAAVALSGESRDMALRAVDFLARVMTTGRARYQGFAESHLQQVANHSDLEVRSRAFVTLYEHQSADSFGKSASIFCGSLRDFINEEAARRIADLGIRATHWCRLTRAFSSLRQSVVHGGAARVVQFVESLLASLANVACMNQEFHLAVRREAVAWRLAPVPVRLHHAADQVVTVVSTRLREKLGAKLTEAVEPETERVYTWGETLRFEDGMNPEEVARIADAVQHTELVREAVFLLHQGRTIDLDDLSPDSIWVSLIGTRFGKSVYHLGVRLRNGERCDFNVHLRATASLNSFLTDLRLSCLAAGGPGEAPLTPQVGGYWSEQGIASVENIPGESVEALLGHMHHHPDRDVCQKLSNAWHHLAWSTLTAAFEFYRRSEGRWVLTGPIAQEISVPLEDYVDQTRIVTTSGWCSFEGPLSMLLRLKGAFLDRVQFHFPAVAAETDEDLLCAAAVESHGLRSGLGFLESAVRAIEETPAPSNEMLMLCRRIRDYIRRIKKEGYMPRSLHFAVKRYREWESQVPGADVYARAAQIRELQKNYKIEDAAAKFPGSRLWLYADTVLADSPAEGRETIKQAIQRLRSGAKIREVLGRLYADLQARLPSHDQQYFLARAAYPHLDLDEKAQLVTTTEVEHQHAELVTTHADRTGRELRIRPVANSRELDTLHRIFYVGGIGGGLTTHETFLVAEDDAGFIVGGVGSIRRTPAHVLLDKIAVLPRCRGRGIGELLLQEFLRRQAAEDVSIVSAEFIRAAWLAQFGFVSHPRYAGLVLELDPPG